MSIFQKNPENLFLKLCTQLVNIHFIMNNANKNLNIVIFNCYHAKKKLKYKTKYYFIKVKATLFL